MILKEDGVKMSGEPTVYRMFSNPLASPPDDVREVCDRHGDRWERLANEQWFSRGSLLSYGWPYIVKEYGPLRDTENLNAPRPRPDWDTYFLDIARAVSARSDCERSKVGAVVVKEHRIRATGYNGAPAGKPGCASCPRRTSGVARESSYRNCVAIHAEANALLYCDREDLIDATLYTTRAPCPDCSKLIDAVGIVRVVCPEGISE